MNSGAAIQQTLTGEETDARREPPETMLLCGECGENVLRSRRDEHEHDLDKAEAGVSFKTKAARDKVPDDCILDTQRFQVMFHYEMVETIYVEAASRADAKEEASHFQTYDGELMQTIHTEKHAVGDPGQASIDYLERHRLLPEDHDVTPTDLQRVIDDE